MKKFMAMFLLLGLAGLLTAADIEIVRIGPRGYTYAMAVKTAVSFDQGDSVCTDATGYALPCTDSASTDFWGFASASADNSTGADGAIKVQAEGGIYNVVFDTVAVTNIGDVAYVKTDQSFAVSGVVNSVIAGKVVKYVDATHAWIDTRTSVNTSAATMTAGNISLADAGSAITATDVEAWGQEIMLGTRGFIPIYNAAGKWAEYDANNDGYILMGDGTDTTSVNITTALTTDGDLARGYIWRGSATGLMEAHDANGSGYMLVGDGTDVASVDVTGDIDISTAGVVSITAGSVVNADLSTSDRATERTVCAWYDFATHGTTSPVTLTACDGAGAVTLPDNAVVEQCWYEVKTAFTVGGASNISLGVTGSTQGITATQDSAHAIYALDKVAVSNTGIPYKVDGADSFLLTASADTITAGTIYIYCNIHQSN